MGAYEYQISYEFSLLTSLTCRESISALILSCTSSNAFLSGLLIDVGVSGAFVGVVTLAEPLEAGDFAAAIFGE